MSLSAIIGLVLIGYLLLFAEVFFPGGLVGMVGVALIVAAVVGSGMKYGSSVAFPLAFGCSIGGVVFFLLWIRYFPSSKMGARLNLKTKVSKEDGYVSEPSDLSALEGKEGVALTELRPSGNARIGDRRVDVVSEGAFISKGEAVVVTEVNSNRVVVRPAGKSSS